ncbi:hypothetical protein SAMN06265364_1901, partial [Prevotella jejuni]
MRRCLSCNAYSLNVKYSSFLNPYICLFRTFILLLMPSIVPFVIQWSYHANMYV